MIKYFNLFAILFISGLLSACNAGADNGLPLQQIQLPPGFQIDIFSDQVPGARSLRRSSDGTVYVSTRGGDKVYALRDEDGDGRADGRRVVAEGLNSPNGIAWHAGDLYIAEIGRVSVLNNIDKRLDDPPKPQVIRDDLPTDSHHGWRYIGVGPDEKLYIAIGAPCNICNEPGFAEIRRMSLTGKNMQTYARGIRNSVGFDWHPDTGALWFTDNGRDWLGDNRPPCELNRAPKAGMHFGYPYCHGGDIADPEYGDEQPCSKFTPPAQKLGPHVAPLGMRFYTGDLFPKEYKNQIFIAEHGSWNRSNKIGYRVTLVRLEGAEAVDYQPFASGWLQGESAWGRPVDVLVMTDGALLVSDDKNGVIYRISYTGDAG